MRLSRIFSLGVLAVIASSSASPAQVVGVSITIAPPVLPVYVQPAIPAPGYIWTPGYWAYGEEAYYWVPGTWVQPPVAGVLWTPGYWGWSNGVYVWNAGYWGPRVGYYGGVNYGYGYGGIGYAGGYWRGGVFSYNRTVNNFGGVTISNTYNRTIINNTNVTRVSYNGGTGGTTAKPTPQEIAAANDPHTPATALQTQHQAQASTNKSLLASINHGNPAVAATSRAGQFTGQGIAAAKTATGKATGSTTGAGIDQREANQQRRIQQGINSGALTKGETNRLEHREQSIANQEQRMRARDGGELTAHNRKVLNNRLNRTSNAIHRDKHDGRQVN